MLSILMPVYNEAATVEGAIEDVLAVDLELPFELIVVDDGSSDGTRELLERLSVPSWVKVLRHPANQGKGAALRSALEVAEGEFVAILDADLEYEASDLATLLTPLLAGDTNAVFGVRAFDGYNSHSYLFVLGNRFVTFIANVLFNVYLHDLMTGQKAVRTDVFRQLDLRASGFAIEPEIVARLLQQGERIFEVPVHYSARATEEGKKLTALDGARVALTLVRCRLRGGRGRPRPRRKPRRPPS